MSETPHPRDSALLKEYARLARTYDARWASYVGATVAETVARLKPLGDERVLDVGCGTGVLLAALNASSPGLVLSGIDPSREMLEVARGRLGSTADLREGWAESLPFGEVSFDAVVSCSVFHYFRNPGRALSEMRRVLVPGGRLVITDWCDDYLSCRLCGLYLRMRRRPFSRIYDSGEMKRLLEEAGFTGVGVERYRIDWLWGLMTANGETPKPTLP